MRLRVIDIETTGEAPPAEIIEVGRVDLVTEGETRRIERPMSRLYRPLHGIPAEAMAVHHLTEAIIGADATVCTHEKLRLAIWGGETPEVLVAHNSAFEQSFIPEALTAPLPWICTYKVALRVWPAAPRHSNQVLRYWRGLDLDAELAMPPHRAAPDAYVTVNLLIALLESATIEQMIAWTAEPKLLPTIPMGKHRGSRWADAPADYLDWMLKQSDMDPDVKWNARRELDRRRGKK